MTNEQFKLLVDNQVAIGKQITSLKDAVNQIQSDLNTAISNQQISENYFQEMKKDIEQIKHRVNS